MLDPLKALQIRTQKALLELVLAATEKATEAIKSGIDVPAAAMSVLTNFAPKIEPKTYLEPSPEERPRYSPEVFRMLSLMAIEDAAKVQQARARDTLLSGLEPATIPDDRKMIDVSPSDDEDELRRAMS